jgi:hypothetical protein
LEKIDAEKQMTGYTDMAKITDATELFENMSKEGMIILLSLKYSFEALFCSMCGCSRPSRRLLHYFAGRN